MAGWEEEVRGCVVVEATRIVSTSAKCQCFRYKLEIGAEILCRYVAVLRHR